MIAEKNQIMLKPKDYKSNQEVRWCPGCGDHAIFNAVLKVFSELELPKEKIAVISGRSEEHTSELQSH